MTVDLELEIGVALELWHSDIHDGRYNTTHGKDGTNLEFLSN